MQAVPRLLVVDDEPIVCDSCQRMFSASGFAVDVSTDAREGLAQAMSNDYAVVLLDVRMPGLDGLDLLARLRPSRPDVPVIVITGYSSIASAAEAKDRGATDYLAKPFTPDELVGAVQRALLRPAPLALRAVPPAEPLSVVDEVLFRGRSWMRLAPQCTVLCGTQLTAGEALTLRDVRIVPLGGRVVRGLPLAELRFADRVETVPSPVTGEVLATGPAWETPPTGAVDSREDGRMVRVSPDLLSRDVAALLPRRLRLLTSNRALAAATADLGCTDDPGASVALVDARSQHPTALSLLRAADPDLRAIVVGAEGRELTWRAAGAFCLVADPAVDLVPALEAAFWPASSPVRTVDPLLRQLSLVRVEVDLPGSRTAVLASPTGHLPFDGGLGQALRDEVHRRGLDARFTARRRDCRATPTADDDVDLLVEVRESGTIPGTIALSQRRRRRDILSGGGGRRAQCAVLTVQPGWAPELLPALASAILDRLAAEAKPAIGLAHPPRVAVGPTTSGRVAVLTTTLQCGRTVALVGAEARLAPALADLALHLLRQGRPVDRRTLGADRLADLLRDLGVAADSLYLLKSGPTLHRTEARAVATRLGLAAGRASFLQVPGDLPVESLFEAVATEPG